MITIIRLSAVLLGGQRYWLLPLLPLLWLAGQAMLLVANVRPSFEPVAAQNTLIGVPVAVLAAFLGGRIIAGELDQRTIEIAYTVPGGTRFVWFGKLAAAALLLAASAALSAALTFALLHSVPRPPDSLWGSAGSPLLPGSDQRALNTLPQRNRRCHGRHRCTSRERSVPNDHTSRVSPFWNPLTVEGADADRLVAMAVQNRIGIALVIAAILALTFARAERRERMLGG